MLILSGCAPLFQPVTTIGTAPTPVVSFEKGGVEDPNVFVDPAAFQAALLQALAARDTARLQSWMTEPILTGTWRADLSDTSPADAVKSLYTEQLGAENRLELVKDADLKALMGGIQPYKNDAHGYSMYLPKDYQVASPNANNVSIVAPQGNGGGHPGSAYMSVETANGRTAEQVVEAVKAELGSGFNVSVGTVMGIDGAQALVVNGLPGQDPNRQLFMVHDDLLYHIIFMPDYPQGGDAYRQMEDVYAMIVNTFHFAN